MKAIKNILLLTFVSGTLSLFAGDFVDNQLWSDYYLYKSTGEKSKFVHRLGSRFTIPGAIENHLFHYRPSFRLKLGQLEPQIGTAIFYINKAGSADAVELRPWLGIKYDRQIASPLNFVNLARLEYRLTNKPIFSDQHDDAFRLRYQFGLKGTLYAGELLHKMYGIATAESFWNLADFNDFNYNLLRLNTGLGVSFSEAISMELIYTKNVEQSGSLNLKGAYSNLFQFKLRHRL